MPWIVEEIKVFIKQLHDDEDNTPLSQSWIEILAHQEIQKRRIEALEKGYVWDSNKIKINTELID